MFDQKKLEAFLDALEVETHLPSRKHGAYAPVENPALEEKMDKYDIFKQDDYQNVGTSEFPVLARKSSDFFQFGQVMYMPMSAYTYAYSGFANSVTTLPPPNAPVESPYDKLKKKALRLTDVEPSKIANPAPLDPARSPDYIGTLTGWRGWDMNNGQLTALGSDFTWLPKTAAKASCRNDYRHRCPEKNCACGFWSFKSFDLMLEAVKAYTTDVMVIGSVEIWGKVIECTNGYRSEFAYPKELWLLEPDLEFLSWTYGVPVRSI